MLLTTFFYFQGLNDFTAIAISADLSDSYVGPCGACRQFMCEFNPEIPIYLVRLDNRVQVSTKRSLSLQVFINTIIASP